MKKEKIFLWLLPVLSGIILSISLDGPHFGWLVLVGFMPFLFFVRCARTKKEYFFGGWLFGFSFFALNLRWFLGVVSGEWAGIQNPAVATVGFWAVWLGSAAVLGLSFALFSLSLKLLKLNLDSLFLIPGVWIIFEYLRSWLFVFWSLGPESLLGPHWTMGNLGYALMSTSSFALSRYVGLYGLSFLVVFINILIFNRRFKFTLFIFLLFFVVVPFCVSDFSSGERIKVDLLQTKSPPVFYYNGLEELLEINPLPDNPENLSRLVVFPEGSNFFSQMTPAAEKILPLLFQENEKGLIITGAIIKDRGENYQTIIYRDQDGKVLEKQKKTFLIPAGEYMPYLLKLVLRTFGVGSAVDVFNVNRRIARGLKSEEPFSFEGFEAGTLSCSGVVSPDLYRQLVKKGAGVLVNSASHEIFVHSEQALFQLETYSRFQAVANARSFLQSSKGGRALIIDANGDFIARGDDLGDRFISGEIQLVGRKTLFTRFGDWPLLLFFVFALVVISREIGLYYRCNERK